VLASLGGAAWTLWEKRQHDPWLRLLQSIHKRLQRSGLQLTAGATPREMAQLLERPPQSLALQAKTLRECLLQLEILRYARHKDGAGQIELSRLRREFQRMDWTQ
jgi:hypothetical protein